MKRPMPATEPLVPALERGVRLVRELEAGPASLHALAGRCAIPKPSAMRLLRTLTALGIARYDAGARTYRLSMRFVPAAEPGSDLSARVAQALERLAHASGDTAEWYVPSDTGMVLTQRHEPPGDMVRVVARAGFVRAWKGEMDAVACVALAFSTNRPGPMAGCWTYDRNGHRVRLTATEASHRIGSARKAGVATDANFNPHGVRRIAAPVAVSGALAGVLAIAGGYRPGLQSDAKSRNALLDAARSLST